jgi:hypothetical protein
MKGTDLTELHLSFIRKKHTLNKDHEIKQLLTKDKRILDFHTKRGVNKESVNEVYRKIILKIKLR